MIVKNTSQYVRMLPDQNHVPWKFIETEDYQDQKHRNK
jgi:hypothetical protein